MLGIVIVQLTGCDQGAGEIVRELDAARAGCTEEGLKASSEECVVMFERFAEMGSDAIETYLGALRALEEAIERRPLDVDVDDLGRAITRASAGSANAGFGTDRNGLRGIDGYAEQGRGASPGESADPWPQPAMPDGYQSDWYMRERDGGVPPQVQRGVLLPPAQRLRRPWLERDHDDLERFYPRRPGLPVHPDGYDDPYRGYPGPWRNDARDPYGPPNEKTGKALDGDEP